LQFILAESHFATIRVGETDFNRRSDLPFTTSYLPPKIIHESFAIVAYVLDAGNSFEVYSSRLLLGKGKGKVTAKQAYVAFRGQGG
jgi:hypothetical protein